MMMINIKIKNKNYNIFMRKLKNRVRIIIFCIIKMRIFELMIDELELDNRLNKR